MVNATVSLSSSTGGMILNTGDNTWTQVQLVDARGKRVIGAEGFEYIANRLVAFLTSDKPSLDWVLTLSEMHTTLYGAIVGGRALLRFQDRDARFFAELELNDDERRTWLAVLQAAMARRN